MEFNSFRVFNNSDIPSVATLLYENLENSILQKLGKNFIQFIFLPQTLKQPGIESYVYETNGDLVAFLLFAKPESAIKALAKKIKFGTLKAAFKKLFREPGLIFELLAGFRNKSLIEIPLDLNQTTYLVYFAVSSQWQRKGIGTQLLQNCLNKLSIYNCIVETKSKAAIRFYQKQGFNIIGIRKRFFEDCTLLLKKMETL